MRILNFPDVGEGPESLCYRELLKYFPRKQIGTVRCSLIETEPNKLLMSCIADGPYDLIVGLGFGAVFALLAGRATGVRTILVNPLCPVQRYLPIEYPSYGFTKELVGLEHGKICWDRRRTSLENVFVILSKDDPVTDSARTAGYFRDGHSVYVEGGHFPCGEDFAKAFGELTGGVGASADEEGEAADIDEEGGVRLSIQGKAIIGGGIAEAEPEEESFDLKLYQSIRIDDFDSSEGGIVIRWSLDSKEPKTHTLYLYYDGEEWHRDEEDGWSSKGDVLAMVLGKAARSFIAQTEPTKHSGKDFWGWAW